GQKTSLTEVARACGCDNVVEVQDKDLGPVLQDAIDTAEMTIIVCKCDSGNIKLPVITMDPVVIKDRFMKAVAS
ncbi:MAG: sulfopyruvate decarboxylase subunit beta, partial [Yoonia sp.]